MTNYKESGVEWIGQIPEDWEIVRLKDLYIDSIAGEVMSRCRDEHVKIPEDIKVASFYNSSLLDSAVPSVTSLNFNDRNLGAEAVRSLLAIIDGEDVQSKMLRNYEVILKESTK